MTMGKQALDRAMTHGQTAGVLDGLIYRVPASGLTALYSGGWVRVRSTNPTQAVVEYAIQPGSNAFTDDVDTYVYINGADGVLTYLEVATGAAKPSLATIGERSQFIALVVSASGAVTAVTDLREMSGADIHTESFVVGLSATEVGAQYWNAPCNGRMLNLQSSVMDALAATNPGTATFAIGTNDVYVAVTNGVITAAASAAEGDRDEATPSAANTFVQGNAVRCTGAKTTAGGKLRVDLTYERLP